MKKEIMDKLNIYHHKQGCAFLSKKDAEDYFKGLVEIIEYFYYRGIQDYKETKANENLILNSIKPK